MTIRLNPRWLLISALLFSLQFVRAQVVVPGTISFDLGGTNAGADTRLWDISGPYQLNLMLLERNGIQVPLTLGFTLVQDADGKLSSPVGDTGTVVISDNDSVFATAYKITGKVTGSAGTARVHFSIRMSGTGTLAGQENVPIDATFSLDAETDTSTGTNELFNTKSSKFSASFKNVSSVRGIAAVETPLPAGVDGSWNLTMKFVALSRLTGTAVIQTSSRNMGLDLSGSFKKSTFKIKAKGALDVPNTTSGLGSSASILLTPTFDSIQLKGKLLGQKLSFFFEEESAN